MALEAIETSLIPSIPCIPADIETLRIYLILPFCFHFAKQYKWPSLNTLLTAYAKKLLAITGGGEQVLRYWMASLGQVRIFVKFII